jgi:cysteine sulfinate desulfinase/cysteine desulfurase-like protein
MRAIGHDETTSQATLRFSFGATTSVQEVRVAVDALRRIVGRMPQAGGASRSAMP